MKRIDVRWMHDLSPTCLYLSVRLSINRCPIDCECEIWCRPTTGIMAASTPTSRPVENQLCTCRRPETASCCSCVCRLDELRYCHVPSHWTHWRSGTDGWSVPLLWWQLSWSLPASCLSASVSPWQNTSTNSVLLISCVVVYTTKIERTKFYVPHGNVFSSVRLCFCSNAFTYNFGGVV